MQKKNPSDVFITLHQERFPLWSSTLLFSTEHHISYKAVLNRLRMTRCIVFYKGLKTEMVKRFVTKPSDFIPLLKNIKLDTIHNIQPCEVSGPSSVQEMSRV
jgi:hypothetical protein